ncbi:MAG TPA: DNA-processing protein DprA [Solirubrobacteraceae bacterium]|nr:DNA-processing protein DprA [Solirubrobacteraceae bacterium]
MTAPRADAPQTTAADRAAQTTPLACRDCLRRAALLELLSERLEYVGRDPHHLVSLLELADAELLQAVGQPDLARLQARYDSIDTTQPPPAGVQRICHHHSRYPAALLQGPGAPRLLHVAGGIERLGELLREPAVAIVGSRAASDYGLEVAHGLAASLAASGVTVIAGLADGIAAAAHTGALDAGGPTLTVMAGGVDVPRPASRRALHRRLLHTGCALAELPCGKGPGGWYGAARSRIVVALAQLVIVVEARERPGDLVAAQLARATGRTLAAVPGWVSSPLAHGPHALLRDGALLVRDAQDALDALYGVGKRRVVCPSPGDADDELDPGLRAVLDRVGAGQDTLGKLLAADAGRQTTLLALARLELGGYLVRGDGGRYLPRV